MNWVWFMAILANVLALVGLMFTAYRQSEVSYLQLQVQMLQNAITEGQRRTTLHDPLDRLEAAHRRIAETTMELQTISDRRHNHKLRVLPGMGLRYIVPVQRDPDGPDDGRP